MSDVSTGIFLSCPWIESKHKKNTTAKKEVFSTE